MRLTVVLLLIRPTGTVPDDLSVGYCAALHPDLGVEQQLERLEVTMSKFAMLSIVVPVYPSFANLLDHY